MNLAPRAVSLFLALGFALPASAAEPLPKGATARLGTAQMRDSGAWGGAQLSSDGKYLIQNTAKGLIRFDVTTGAEAGMVGKPRGGFDRRVQLCADGSRAIGLAFSSATIWETASGKDLAVVKRQIPFSEAAASLSANGKILALGGARDFNAKEKPVTALVWDVDKNAKLAEVAVLQNQSASVVISPDGKLLATWGSHFGRNPPKEENEPAKDPSRIVQFWDAAAGKELAQVVSDGYGIARVAFSPDGKLAALSSGNGSIQLINPRTGAAIRRLFSRGDQGSQLAFSPDGKTLATGGYDGCIQLFNVAEGSRLGIVDCPAGILGNRIRGITFATPGRAVAWTTLGITAIVWEVPSGKLLSPLGGHISAVRSIAFVNEGKEVRTSGDEGLIFRWDAAGKLLGEVRIRPAGSYGPLARFPMTTLHLSPDGALAYTESNTQGLFEAATGRQVAATGGIQSGRTFLLPDARTLLIAPRLPSPPKPQPESLKVPVWNVATGMKLSELETEPGEFQHAAITPDRKKLITAIVTRKGNRSDYHITAWELPSGKKLGSRAEPGSYGATFLVAAPDNASVLAATPQGKLLLINLEDGKIVKTFEVNGRMLTAPPVFSPSGKQIAMASALGFGASVSREIQILDVASGKTARTIQGRAPAITSLAFSPDGKTLASGSSDTTVLLWDLAAAKP